MSETSLQEKPDVKSYINDRDFNAEFEYEYGSRAGFWRLFRLFEKYGMKLTLCAVAEALEAQQEAVTRRVTRPRFSAAQESFIQQATQSLKALSGHAPHGWFYRGSSLNSRTLVPTVYADMGRETEMFCGAVELCQVNSEKEGVWVATRTEIAEVFKAEYPYRKSHLA
ncbi:hypothetical protein S40293_08906 [Stachybotrys chartarum IBT 40293]|nr:hypothetical protein S40293_08906 [Stachybotrys chartarum IBT 40293]